VPVPADSVGFASLPPEAKYIHTGGGGGKRPSRVKGIMFKNIGGFFKQAKEMQTRMTEIQDELGKKKVEVSTGGGMVRITANGLNEILSVHIDDELINLQDREILEDLVVGAVNETHRKVKDLAQEEMKKLTGGIKIPGLTT